MSPLMILNNYASKANPAEELLPSVLFAHTDKTITVFDAYPKSIFHFLVLPRTRWCQDDSKLKLGQSDIKDLKALLAAGKEKAKRVLEEMKAAADECVKQVQEEMKAIYGIKWDVWMGFHPCPSMPHIHLHVISADLCSPSMKTKKHYRSFVPKMNFFLKLDEVFEWLEATPSFFKMKAKLKSEEYTPRLKGDLTCFHCHDSLKSMNLLKDHLQEEFDKQVIREKAKLELSKKLMVHKRKREERAAASETRSSSQVSATSSAAPTEDAEGSQPVKKRKDGGNA